MKHENYKEEEMGKLKKGEYHRDDDIVLRVGRFVRISHQIMKSTGKRTREEMPEYRTGMIVGFRNVPFKWKYSLHTFDDETPYWEFKFDGPSKCQWVVLVCLYPTHKPREVLPDDCEIIEATTKDLKARPQDAREQRELIAEKPELFPRDDKGRFVPVCCPLMA